MLRGNKTFYLACLLGLLLTACAKKDPPPFERPPSPVTVATAVSQDVPLYLDEVGHTRRPGSGFRPTRSIRADHGNPFRRRRRFEKGRPAVYDRSAAVPGAARCGASQPGAIESGAGFCEDSVCPRARIWSSRRRSRGRITTRGKMPWTWAKRRSSKTKPRSSPRA